MGGAAPRIGPGERAPDFVLPCEGRPTRFYGRAGGAPTVLVFPPSGSEAEVAECMRELRALEVFVIARRPPEAGVGAPLFVDAEGKVWETFGASPSGLLVVTDANLRVVRVLEPRDEVPFGAKLARSALDAISELPLRQPVTIVAQAPVLLVPRVLGAEDCAKLIDVWSREGNEETGVEISEREGRRDVIRSALKRRRDHTVRDPSLTQSLARTLGRRLIPEVRRAFCYPVSRFEGFKIVRYDAESGGFFRAHRDNLSPATAHRRFALTLNLNEGYEGGKLRFPEHGPLTYRPAAGEALLFSCSLLHEVTELRSGERFALLSFLFGEHDVRGPV